MFQLATALTGASSSAPARRKSFGPFFRSRRINGAAELDAVMSSRTPERVPEPSERDDAERFLREL
jgi:hypothetical protein